MHSARLLYVAEPILVMIVPSGYHNTSLRLKVLMHAASKAAQRSAACSTGFQKALVTAGLA